MDASKFGVPKEILWVLLIAAAFFLGLKRGARDAEPDKGSLETEVVRSPLREVHELMEVERDDAVIAPESRGRLGQIRSELERRIVKMRMVERLVALAKNDGGTVEEAVRFIEEHDCWQSAAASDLQKIFFSYRRMDPDAAFRWIAKAPKKKIEVLNSQLADDICDWSIASKGQVDSAARAWLVSQRDSAYYDAMANAYVVGAARFNAEVAREVAQMIGDEELRVKALAIVESDGNYAIFMKAGPKVVAGLVEPSESD